MRITFHGAAGEVTGSCFLVETDEVRFLVDCGLFQGGRDAWPKNLEALSFDLRSLDFILITHAHLDHSGLLPRAVALGFRGPAHATAATADLLGVMLLDSAHIQEKEAEWEAKRAHGKRGSRQPRPPLYSVAQAQACLKQIRRAQYDQSFQPHAAVKVCLRDAGHILGSAIAEVWVESAGRTRKLVFSGDLGMPDRPVLCDPQPIEAADALFVESTYGNRLHKPLEATEDELVDIIERTLRHKGGNVVMPAFSVGRTQEVIFVLTDLAQRGRLKNLQVVVDSPMSMAATEITLKHTDLLDQRTRDLIAWQRAHPEAVNVRFVQDVEESIALNQVRGGLVIISASGMCDAGRIKYHLLHNLGRRECAVVITGFQAAGTQGRRLVEGAKSLTLFGKSVPVRAEIRTIGGLSAHADQEGLLGWLGHFRQAPRQIFIVHGEVETAHIFADAVTQRLKWQNVSVPQRGQTVEMN
ncbi:MAG: MBL fold metallo-hydrolase [Rhodocyclaceae bacterium]|jgi:metallo-beta-lactamase family protein|nr:MBL fold metallo-hydrolase [Rhodocyclaceae bacterium]MCO5098728.1 MBL fold metallo-hydrolase [Rhodocyclaceae bacterium]